MRLFLVFLIFMSIPLSGADIIPLRIFYTSDTHGHNLAQLAWTLGNARKNFSPHSQWYFDGGDTNQGTWEMAITEGNYGTRVLDHLQCDFKVPGNHDFEFGMEAFRREFEKSRTFTAAANLKIDSLVIPAWKMFESQGVKLAVIGLTEGNIAERIYPPGSVTITDWRTAVQNAIAEAEQQNADIFIAVAHCGEYGKTLNLWELAKEFPRFDLILGGHSHETVPGKEISEVYVVQPGEHGEFLAEITIFFDSDTRQVVDMESKLLITNSGFTAPIPELNLTPDTKPLPFPQPEKAKTPTHALAKLTAQAMRHITNCDIGFYAVYGTLQNWPNSVDDRSLYELLPYHDRIVNLSISHLEWETIIRPELEALQNDKIYFIAFDGTVPEDRNVFTLTLPSYIAAGAAGRCPEVRKLAAIRGKIPSETATTLVRDAVKLLLQKRAGSN